MHAFEQTVENQRLKDIIGVISESQGFELEEWDETDPNMRLAFDIAS